MKIRNLKLTWSNVRKMFFFMGPKMITFYFVIFLLITIFLDCSGIVERGHLKALNRMLPDLHHLAEIEEGKTIDAGKLGDARLYYQKVIEYRPQSKAAYGMLGFCYYYSGQPNKAIEAYKKAVKLNPDFFAFHYNLGVLYHQKGDFGKAVDALERAVATEFDKNIIFVTTSRFYFLFLAKGKDEISYQLRMRFRDNYSDAYKLLILNYFRLKDFSKIMGYSKEAFALGTPDAEFFLYQQGLLVLKSGGYAQALRIFQKIVEINPRNAGAFYSLGVCLKALGQENKGEQALQQAKFLSDTARADLPKKNEFKLRLF